MKLKSSFIIFLFICLSPSALYASGFLKFPPQFKWCVATSAHQIEGNNIHSDWWAWEHMSPSKIKNNEKSLMATDHWNRYSEDVRLMNYLGIDQYRFSIEWAKIEPSMGKFDQEAINHYRDEIIELKKNNITPMITLHHFTSPKWFADRGGWSKEDAPALFAKYVQFTQTYLGDLAYQWITFNEPMVMVAAGYIDGIFPPGISDWNKVSAPIKNILRAHAKAYHILHKNKLAKVGMAHHLRIMEALNKLNPIEQYLAHKLSKSFNWAIPNALKSGKLEIKIPTKIDFELNMPDVKGTQDFIGVNYYSRDLIEFTPKDKNPIKLISNPKGKKSDLGWEIYPEGFTKILKDVHDLFPDSPIYITENGTADGKDHFRTSFIQSHLEAIHRAIKDGVPVKGYCHWSLLDNFEWVEGFHPRFGLFHVNYKTFERTPRKSALFYKTIIENNGLNSSEK